MRAKNLIASISKLSQELVQAKRNLTNASDDLTITEQQQVELEDIVQDIENKLFDAKEELDAFYDSQNEGTVEW